jgi:hypothetical protein
MNAPDPRHLYDACVAGLDRPEIVALADRWAVLGERDRHLLVLHLAAAGPGFLADALAVVEALPCLDCGHDRHQDAGPCVALALAAGERGAGR